MTSKSAVKQVKDKDKVKVKVEVDYIANLVSYVDKQKDSRALVEALESWFVHVQGRVTSILAEHNKAITELDNTEDLDGLMRWVTSAFQQVGQYSKQASAVKNAMVVGAYRLSSDRKLVTGDMLKFRSMVCDALNVQKSTRKQIRALTSTYPMTALQVEREMCPLSVYRVLAKVASQWDKANKDPKETRQYLDAYTSHFVDQYNKAPSYTNMNAHLEESHNPSDTALNVVKNANEHDIIRRKAKSILAKDSETLDGIKSSDRQAKVKAEIESILNGCGFMPHNPKDISATLTRYVLSFDEWSNRVDLDKVQSQLMQLVTLVTGKIKLNNGVKAEHDATKHNDDQWSSALDEKTVGILEDANLTPFDVGQMTQAELCAIKGIGKATSVKIMASVA
jgi:hypothetical protein